jgi:hypothetical protein
VTVTLPWPHGTCWPNSRAHYHVVAKHRRAQRHTAWALGYEAGLKGKGEATLRIALHPPRRPGLMNVDGCIAACKSALDGLADVLGVDDSRLRIEWPVSFAEPVRGGAVVVHVEAAMPIAAE